MAWWEGEDIDIDSQLSHVTKAIASLVVLRDAMMNDMMEDDRPPAIHKEGQLMWMYELNDKAASLINKYPESKDPFTEKSVPRLPPGS